MQKTSSPAKGRSDGSVKDKEQVITGRVRWDDNLEPVEGTVSILQTTQGKESEAIRIGKNGIFKIEGDDIGQACGAGDYHLLIRSPEGVILYNESPQRGNAKRMVLAHDVLIKSDLRHSPIPEVQTIKVGELHLNALELEKIQPEDVLNIARAIVYPKIAEREKEKISRLSRHLIPAHLTKRWQCETPIINTLYELVILKRWPRDIALKIEDILRMREDGFAEHTHECTNFTITYQDSGPAAVPASTAAEDVFDPGTSSVLASLPAGGAPTYVKRVCFWLERALAAYVNPPFSMLNPAAGGKIQVIINSAAYGSATASAFYINNNLDPDVLCAVAVHELFHMVQYEYGGTGTWRGSVFEGGAVFAEDSAADLMNRYIDETRSNFNGTGVLADPNKSLDTAAYKASLFWRYIAEQHSGDLAEPFVGVETYRKVIEKCSAGSYSTDDVKAAIRELPWYQDFYQFGYLDPAHLDRTSSETTFGNYALACYLKDLGTNQPDSRFDFIEDEENIHIDNVIGGGPADITSMPSVSITSTLTLTPASGALNVSGSVNRLASRYYVVNIDPDVTNVEVEFNANAGFTSLLFQIALIDEDGHVRDIHRTDKTSYTKYITNIRDGKTLTRLLLLASGCEQTGSFTINISTADPAPDVMVTRWHSSMKREYEIDSKNWAWTWVSPDIWVDNDNNGTADSEVFFNYNNKLNIRLHNKGNAMANNINVSFYYQNAAAGLSDAGWLPVRNTGGTIQTLTGLSLAAESSNNWSVDWSPAPDGTSNHFCIRAIVNVPGDPNTDNKRILSNFGNVVSGSPFFDLRLLRRNVFDKLINVRARLIPRLPVEYSISGYDLKRLEVTTMQPGEVRLDEVRIVKNMKATQATIQEDVHLHKMYQTGVLNRRLKQRPSPQGQHPTPANALPPGVAGKPMVTVVHEIDGVAIGGVTFMLSEKKK